jgi:sterol desaturase/sphingolipid hydroxylase (fatty acid hydroxylase superfamily)
MHRIHHSDREAEQRRNYGDLFPWWDRAFRTYQPPPATGAAGLTPGLQGFQTADSLGVGFMLKLPFRRAE